MNKSVVRTLTILAMLLYFSGAILPLWFDQGKTSNRTEVPLAASGLQVLYDRIMYILAAIIALSQTKTIVKFLESHPIVLFIFAYMLLSVIWAIDPVESFKSWVGMALPLTFGIYLANQVKPLQITYLVATLFACIVVVSWFFILRRPDLGIQSSTDGDFWRGAYEDRNDLGLYMNIAFLTFLTVWRTKLKKYLRYGILLPLLVLTICLIFFSHSGTGIISFFLLLLTYALLPVLRKGATVFLIVIPCILIIGTIVSCYYGDILSLLGKDETLTGRIEIWGNALDAWAQNPILGYGAQNIYIRDGGQVLTTTFSDNGGVYARASHNLYIAIFLKYGLVGSTLFLYFFAQLLFVAFKENQRNRDVVSGWYVLLLSAILTYGLTLTIDNAPFIWVLYACILYSPEVAELNDKKLCKKLVHTA